ncbi:MAG TPA: RodZ domain-containing protein [Candidatus Angelobacter sp.]|nr:RodZ domain-containing protein [Candidatus Angelobacter sp.]
MSAFGDRLRREREMRGITLDEISESTKISRRHLEALEGEHFDQLPGGVFNKGFVRAYAHFLGIDEDQAVSDYSLASNEQPEPEDKFPLEIHDEPDRELNPRRSKLPLVFAAAALAGVLVGYAFWAKSRPTNQESSVQASSAATTTTPNAKDAANKDTARKVAETSAPSTRQVEPSAPVAAAVQPEKHAAEQKAPEQDAAKPKSVLQKPQEKAFIITVKAKEDSWVSIVADGRSVMQRVLTADRQKLVKAGKQVVLRTGNAGGIDVTFNGKPIGALGNENEPRTLTFSAAGLVQ